MKYFNSICLSIVLILLLGIPLYAQNDSIPKPLKFTGDFRFRVEHDWNSRKQNGDYRDDRSRLRFRFRFGLNYQLNQKYSFGGRLRTGNINDQQGPHLTLGGGNGEFGLTQIGLEKLFFQWNTKSLKGWIGKNTILLEKQNELFWNDNVFPEGVALSRKWKGSGFVESLNVNGGHYIINSNGKSFDQDSYFQLIQIVSKHWKDRLVLFPAFYYFNNIGNIPDGQENYRLNYSIFHLGTKVTLLQKPYFNLGFDYYNNIQDYQNHQEITSDMKSQNQGWVISTKLGQLKDKGDWILQFYYAYLQKYSIVDYFAQNDWARWDYSSQNASGSRISNFKGFEIRIGYNIEQRLNLILRMYSVKQLVTQGNFKENGDRIRLDLNIGF